METLKVESILAPFWACSPKIFSAFFDASMYNKDSL